MLVNIVLSFALLLVVFNVHFGIIVAKRFQSSLFGLINWGMAFILLVCVIQKIYEINFV